MIPKHWKFNDDIFARFGHHALGCFRSGIPKGFAAYKGTLTSAAYKGTLTSASRASQAHHLRPYPQGKRQLKVDVRHTEDSKSGCVPICWIHLLILRLCGGFPSRREGGIIVVNLW